MRIAILPPMVLAMVLATPTAHAQISAADAKVLAREHYDKAQALVKQNKLDEAIDEYRRAYELSPHFSVLYSLGNTYSAAGRSALAIDAFERYLRDAAAAGKLDPARKREVEKAIAAAKERTASVTLVGLPDGADVAVDGATVGKTPLPTPLRLDPGNHMITATHDGYVPGEAPVQVAAKETPKIELRLQRAEPSPPLPAPPAPTVIGPTGVMIDCKTPGVALWIDGEPHGATPLAAPIELPPGLHRVRFEKPGFRGEVTIPVEAGKLAVASCGLIVISTPAPPPDHDQRAPARWLTSQRVAGLALGGLGLAAGIAAASIYGFNDGRYKSYKSEFGALDAIYGAGPPYDAGIYQRQSDNDALMRSIQSLDKVSLGLTIAGGTLLATGVVLVATGGGPAPSAMPVVQPARGGMLVGYSQSF